MQFYSWYKFIFIMFVFVSCKSTASKSKVPSTNENQSPLNSLVAQYFKKLKTVHAACGPNELPKTIFDEVDHYLALGEEGVIRLWTLRVQSSSANGLSLVDGLQATQIAIDTAAAGPREAREYPKFLTDEDFNKVGAYLESKYPNFVQIDARIATLAPMNEGALAKQLEAAQKAGKRFVGIPQNSDKQHWMGWLIDLEKKSIEYFDSKAMSIADRDPIYGSNHYLSRRRDFLKRTYPNFTFYEVLPQRPQKIISDGEVVGESTEGIQRNGYMCGVHVEHYFHYALENVDLLPEERVKAMAPKDLRRATGSIEEWETAMMAYRQFLTESVYPESAAAKSNPIKEFQLAKERVTSDKGADLRKLLSGDKFDVQSRFYSSLNFKIPVIASPAASTRPKPLEKGEISSDLPSSSSPSTRPVKSESYLPHIIGGAAIGVAIAGIGAYFYEMYAKKDPKEKKKDSKKSEPLKLTDACSELMMDLREMEEQALVILGNSSEGGKQRAGFSSIDNENGRNL